MYDHDRPHPHVLIPSGPQRPVTSAHSSSPYAFEVTPPGYDLQQPLSNPWDTQPSSPDTARPRTISMLDLPVRPLSRASSVVGNGSTTTSMLFPEPQIYRSASHRTTLHPNNALTHRHNRSDLGPAALRLQRDPSTSSLISTASSYYPIDESDHYGAGSGESHEEADYMSRELSNLSLDSEEGLRRFQAGDLPANDQEWHRLVPPEAREALGKQEVQRQSVLFEVIKSEREYVFDLEAVQEVFIEPLRNASPPIISESILPEFIAEVFGNLRQILSHHQRTLGALFDRQRDQHPLIQSVADIILDTTLKSDFRSAYETYIKHYPLSESRHRTELKRNPAYHSFVQSVSSDPRIRKRDLITFLSRPVTRLPRLNLLLEQILKLTDKEYTHPDLETLPIILGILKDCIKSTQPGIEAAENKVKFWAFGESLVYQKGEIIDMDLYDDSRTLVYSGSVSRRVRTDTGFSGWMELNVALLDNFFVLTREETRPNGVIKRHLMSRPLPLSYLRLGSFTSEPETRRERTGDGGILDSLRHNNVPIYPFTVYHTASKSTRRYTLYVTSEALRKRWHAALVDAVGVHKARQEGNMWFVRNTLSDRFFRLMGTRIAYNPGTQFTGRITSAVPFTVGGRRFIAVGCPSGIYVSPRGKENFRKVLKYSSPTSLAAIQTLGKKTFNRFIVHFETSLLSYSLDILARVALGQAEPTSLDASLERIAGQDANVLFFRHARVGQRVLLIYASKKRLQVTLGLHVLEAIDTSQVSMTPRRANGGVPISSFRPFGESGYVPKDAHEVTPLVKTIGISTLDGIVIVDPTNLAKSAVNIVPDFHDASTNLPMSALKKQVEGAKPLGLVRCDAPELLVIYDVLGCYITKHGVPSRSSGYIKWESQAKSYAHRGVHVLLFSPQFIEIRDVTTGRLVQVIEASDLRLLHSGPMEGADDTILVAMRGEKDDQDGISDKIVELVETTEIISAAPSSAVPSLWDEWDM